MSNPHILDMMPCIYCKVNGEPSVSISPVDTVWRCRACGRVLDWMPCDEDLELMQHGNTCLDGEDVE